MEGEFKPPMSKCHTLDLRDEWKNLEEGIETIRKYEDPEVLEMDF
jgi:hypothetical protein